MFEKKKFCFIWIFLHMYWGVGMAHQPVQLDTYANSRSFPQLEHQQQQQHLFDANQNYYVPNAHNSPQYSHYAVAAAVQPNGYDVNGTPNHQEHYQYPTPSTHSQLWSSAPIVVADDAANVLVHNDQVSRDYKSDLQTRPRSSKALPLTYNINRHVQQQQQQQVPSSYNYPNPAVYHSSDVWRQQQQQQHHQQQQNSLNYNRQQPQNEDAVQQPPLSPPYRQQHYHHHHHQQQQQQLPQQHQLYASNTDLNYLEATPINHRPYSSDRGMEGGKNTTAEYSEHFKEYLRKHPRRIKPIY